MPEFFVAPKVDGIMTRDCNCEVAHRRDIEMGMMTRRTMAVGTMASAALGMMVWVACVPTKIEAG